MRYIAHPVDKKVCQLSTTPNDWGDGWIIFDRETNSLIKTDPTNDEIPYLTWLTPIYACKDEAEYAIECLNLKKAVRLNATSDIKWSDIV